LHNGEDNRLTAVMIDHAIKPALDAVERHWRGQWRSAQNVKGKEGAKGALIIVGKQSQDKFFSNGALICALTKRMGDKIAAQKDLTFQASRQIPISSLVCYISWATLALILNVPTDTHNPFLARLLTFPSRFFWIWTSTQGTYNFQSPPLRQSTVIVSRLV
jgi:hypothetical protein